jgi:hypothetical protein
MQKSVAGLGIKQQAIDYFIYFIHLTYANWLKITVYEIIMLKTQRL